MTSAFTSFCSHKKTEEPCPNCGGSGLTYNEDDCAYCNGSGMIGEYEEEEDLYDFWQDSNE